MSEGISKHDISETGWGGEETKRWRYSVFSPPTPNRPLIISVLLCLSGLSLIAAEYELHWRREALLLIDVRTLCATPRRQKGRQKRTDEANPSILPSACLSVCLHPPSAEGETKNKKQKTFHRFRSASWLNE